MRYYDCGVFVLLSYDVFFVGESDVKRLCIWELVGFCFAFCYAFR
jgi:hypothetical protein